ncbi:unnamed protein product [Parnassius apollo]|uniref:(apollo) hypothetical protein n=1 Tax=Parnassius apollo TaxID=110799 RepID=A0A8S3X3E7_PARAO|nr:unnamed protein product [Parnassius apollo]
MIMSRPKQLGSKEVYNISNLQTLLVQGCLESSKNPLWIIQKSDLGGRGLFARKRIHKGELILTNKPLAVGPRNSGPEISFCSYCYETSDEIKSCEKCGLLMCSKNCKVSQMHLEECKFISTYWKPKSNSRRILSILGRIRIYIQLFLLSSEKKEILLHLQHDSTSTFQELEAIFSSFHIPKEHIELMKTMHLILKINSFRIPSSNREKTIRLCGLYPLAAFLNHSCVPNTRNIFKNDKTMEIYASRDIEIGEEILSCYTSLIWCTPVRRYQLHISKNFWCKCSRCNDATEMGTKLSALKCFVRECAGALLPHKPLIATTEWCCDTCHAKVPVKQINFLQSIIGSLVRILSEEEEIEQQNVILKRLESFLPCYSYIFLDLDFKRALKLGYDWGTKLKELSESRLALKEKLCRGTLRTTAALGAGDAHLRGLLLYHLHAALAERARRSPDLYDELKSEIESTIDQAYNILQGDISAPPDLELRRRYLGPGCDKSQEERFFILDEKKNFVMCTQ